MSDCGVNPTAIFATSSATGTCTLPSVAEIAAAVPATSAGELTVTSVMVIVMIAPGERKLPVGMGRVTASCADDDGRDRVIVKGKIAVASSCASKKGTIVLS